MSQQPTRPGRASVSPLRRTHADQLKRINSEIARIDAEFSLP